MFKLDNLGIIVEAASGPYPYGRLINSSPPGSGNGSPAIAEWANDAVLGMYAGLDHFGITPSDLQEQVGDSDFVRLLQAVQPVGTFIGFGSDTDPATLDIRALVCDGSTVSEVTYAALFAVVGIKWNTGGEPGGEFRLPDFRGKFRRGFDDGAGVDSGRVFGAAQADASQGHLHYSGLGSDAGIWVYGVTPNDMPGLVVAKPDVSASVPANQGLGSTPKTDSINGTPRTAAETRPINETEYVLIRY